MIGALASLLLILGAALVVGQAIAVAASGVSRRSTAGFSWAAPAVGLAALLVLAGVGIRLPGHAATAAAVVAVAVLASIVHLQGRMPAPGREWLPALAVVAGVAAAASLPFLIADNFGILGAGLVNDDMASHLIIADYISDPGGPVPTFVEGGYPTGPHALVAAVAAVTGASLVEGFAGLTLALAALLGLSGLGLLRELPPLRRILGACVVALSYLAAAYLAQGAFKEPLMTVLLIGWAISFAGAIGLRDGQEEETSSAHPALRAAPLGVLVAGVVFAYSLPGLLWVGVIGAALILARLSAPGPKPRLPEGWLRAFAPYALGGLALVAAVVAIEWDRISKFTRLEALSPDRFGSQLGNLAQSLNPLEALGIWPSSEFDATASSAGAPAIVFYVGAAIALAAFAVGLVTAFRARRFVLPAAAIAALVAWGLLAIAGSPYVAAKALAIAAPIVIAVSLRGTLGGRAPALALGLALVLGASLSSFLVLRAAAVGPEEHFDQLDSFRDEIGREDVLFLGRDDFIGWELRGSGEITGVVTNFYDVEDAKPRFKKGRNGGEKFDVDVLFPRQLARFPYVVATRGGPASEVPPSFSVAAKTSDYVLYEQEGRIGRRLTLNEGTEPGKVLDCSKPSDRAISRGRGFAVIWDPAPVIASPEEWEPDAEPADGAPSTQQLDLAPGLWQISLEYDSRRELRVRIPGHDFDEGVPANLDFRGETPTFPVGELDVAEGDAPVISVEPEEPNPFARLLRAPNEAHLRSLTATPADPDAVRRVPLTRACGEYVDWYRPG